MTDVDELAATENRMLFSCNASDAVQSNNRHGIGHPSSRLSKMKSR